MLTSLKEIPDEVKRRRVLHLTCCLLPKSHRDSLEILFSFLGWASSFSEIDDESGSKMDTHNLATVITPNVLKEKTEKAGMDESSFLAIEAINSLIEYNEYMCEVSRSICAPPEPETKRHFHRCLKISNQSLMILLSLTTLPKLPPRKSSNAMATALASNRQLPSPSLPLSLVPMSRI